MFDRLRKGLTGRTFPIDPSAVRHDDGHAFVVDAPDWTQPSDGVGADSRSRLRLFEGGKELLPGHSPHAEIRTQGRGRFSHWETSLYFSSSDNTSPLENGRRYEARLEPLLRQVAEDSGARLKGAAAAKLLTGARCLASLGLSAPARPDVLYAAYDLDQAPVTFDIATELVVADIERRRRGLSKLHFVIVPGEWRLRHQDGFSAAVDDDATALRLQRIALPVTRLLPSCTGVTICASREEARRMLATVAGEIHPRGYDPLHPETRQVAMREARDPDWPPSDVFPLFRANPAALAAARAFLKARLGDRKAIVVTLRQSAFVPARNSHLDAWLAFADEIDRDRYGVVFVPDSERAFLPDPHIDRHVRCDVASLDTAYRMALYEAAHLNLAHMGGPLELALYNEACRYAIFIPVGRSPQTRPELLESRGFRIGSDLPFARPGQRIVWDADSLPRIREIFAEMEAGTD